MNKQFIEEDIKKIIPKSFETSTLFIPVEVKEQVESNEYSLGELLGSVNPAKQAFQVGTDIKTYKSGVVIDSFKLSPDKVIQTYFHELYHYFQEYCGKSFNEQDANLFSNFMLEYEKTKLYHD